MPKSHSLQLTLGESIGAVDSPDFSLKLQAELSAHQEAFVPLAMKLGGGYLDGGIEFTVDQVKIGPQEADANITLYFNIFQDPGCGTPDRSFGASISLRLFIARGSGNVVACRSIDP